VATLPKRIITARRDHRDHDSRLARMTRADLLRELAEALAQASEPELPPTASMSDDALRALVLRLQQARCRQGRSD
jgi:hypothetical protein